MGGVRSGGNLKLNWGGSSLVFGMTWGFYWKGGREKGRKVPHYRSE